MTRRAARQFAGFLCAAAVMFACLGAQCQDSLPQARFLLLEPTELERAGFCEDWGPGTLFHEGETCFRRENCVFDCPQVCVDEDGNTIDSRDTVSPVVGTAPNGRCLYDMPWDPVSGFSGGPAFWSHAVLDVALPVVTGAL